ncbi:MAG: type II secretion system protein GspG [Lentisphaeria bacterium]|nr:type II secretion system protein GspG [Lentisphaeria bacterium]
MKTTRFFTLVELLIAAAIIAVLAGIGFAGYSFAVNSGRESSTKSLIHQMTTVFDTCHNKAGFYPASSSFQNIVFTFDSNGIPSKVAIGGVEYLKTDVGSKKQLFDTVTKMLDMENIKSMCGTDGILRDSWGNEIKYCSPGKINKNKYDIVSAGVDGKFGKDLVDTPPLTKAEYADCADIHNF